MTSQAIMALKRRAESFVRALYDQGLGTAKSQRLNRLSIFVKECGGGFALFGCGSDDFSGWSKDEGPSLTSAWRGLHARFEWLERDPGAVAAQAMGLERKRRQGEIARQQAAKQARIECAFPHFGVSLILDLVDQALEYEELAGRPWVTQDQRGARR